MSAERGEKGDHGQQGEQGEQGETSYTPLVLRHITAVFIALLLMVGLNAAFTEFRYRQLCKAGNARSDVARNQIIEQRIRTEAFDFKAIVNLPEPQKTELADAAKAHALATADYNANKIPYVNCSTGRIKPPALDIAPPKPLVIPSRPNG